MAEGPRIRGIDTVFPKHGRDELPDLSRRQVGACLDYAR